MTDMVFILNDGIVVFNHICDVEDQQKGQDYERCLLRFTEKMNVQTWWEMVPASASKPSR
jgi:hypothetical protein